MQKSKTNFKNTILALMVLQTIIVPSFVYSAVAPNGVLIYSDSTTASSKFRKLTNPTTLGSETSTGLGSSVDSTNVVVKRANTKEEFMIGEQGDTGSLRLSTCTTGCDAGADYTARQTITSVSSTFDRRAFDIAYERMSDRAMVVYANTSNTGKLYYCLWNGSSFSPVSNCTATNGSNSIDLTDGTTALTGTPTKVKLIQGKDGTNDIWLLVEDSNADLFITRWDGSSWSSGAERLTASTALSCDDADATVPYTDHGMCFGLGIENVSNDAVLIYGEDTNNIYYRTFTTSWSSATLWGTTLASNANWIFVSSDYESDRLAIASGAQGNDFRPIIWKADGSTPGLTSGNNDTTAEAMSGNNIDGYWQRGSGSSTRTAVFVYTDSNLLHPSYETASCTGSGCTFSSIAAIDATSDCADDCSQLLLRGNPGGDDMIMVGGDIDGDLAMWRWTGSWALVAKNLTTAGFLSPKTTANSTNQSEFPFWYEYYMYSPWARNWRFTGDTTNNTPSTWLANENITPTGVAITSAQIRLRYNVAELGTTAQSNSRKKLQYTTGDPDDVTSTWTDVGAQGSGSIWRYWNGPGTDDANVSATQLTGSTAVGPFWENGTSASTYDQSASSVSEFDYSIESNGASNSTTYYFRMFDNADVGAVFRQQNFGATPCAGSSVCTYPSLTTAGASGPSVTTNFANPGATTASLSGTLTSGDSATDYGFAYGTNSSLTSGTATTSLGTLSSNDTFSTTISSLSTGATYYFRAYATKSGVTAFGSIKSFITGNSNVTRKLRLFEGFKMKFFNGKIILHQN